MKNKEKVQTLNSNTHRLYNIEFYYGRVYSVSCDNYPGKGNVYRKYRKDSLMVLNDPNALLTPKYFNEALDNIFLDKEFKDYDKLLKNLYDDPEYLKIAQERIRAELNKILDRALLLSDALCGKDKNK